MIFFDVEEAEEEEEEGEEEKKEEEGEMCFIRVIRISLSLFCHPVHSCSKTLSWHSCSKTLNPKP